MYKLLTRNPSHIVDIQFDSDPVFWDFDIDIIPHVYIADVKTLETTINELSTQTSLTDRKLVIGMDAGIIADNNLKMLKEREYSYR